MKTTKIGMALFALGLVISMNTSAQIYFGLGGGYGFAAGKQDMISGPDVSSTTNYNNTAFPNTFTKTETFTARSYSIGKGGNIGLYGGYMFNKYLGAELGISYLIGASSIGTTDYATTTLNFGGGSSSTDNKTTTTVKGSMVRLVPGLRVQIGEKKIKTYATAGIIIGVAGKATMETNNVNSQTGMATTTTDQINTLSGGMSWGLHSSIGVCYAVSGMIGIFGEISANLQNAHPSKNLETTYTVNGADKLSTLTTSQKETDYSSPYTVTTTQASVADPGAPQQAASINAPFSSIGFNIGVHITLGGK